ncbi:hypothetical protein TRVA0_044S00892 [Trichomonascus vanleenenianus]|uniref:uncharacterized protein n=1 Tax=Trichomonascus vanleenenianus TaxID=2268995 RepID=UPI003ECA621E
MSERPLGTLEKSFAISSEYRLATVVAVSAEYSCPLTKQNLFPALIQLIKEEPLLCSNIFVQKNKYTLVKITETDLNDVVKFYPSIPFGEDYINTELFPDGREPLPHNEKRLPLWRIDVLGNSELVWSFDHTIFDGQSAIIFHRKLLRVLREIHKTRRTSYISSSQEEDVSSIAKSGPLALPLPIEQQAKVSLPIKVFFKLFFDQMVRNMKGKNSPLKYKKHIIYAEPPPLCPIRAKLVLLQLSAGQIRALKEKAGEYGVNLTAMFYSALTQAIMLQLPEEKLSAEPGLAFVTDIPVNARPLTYRPNRTNNELGNLVFLHQYHHALPTYLNDKTGFKPQWAKDFEESLKDVKTKSPSPASYPIAGLRMVNLKKFLTERLMKRRKCMAEISNLGLASFNGEDPKPSDSPDVSSSRSPVADSDIPEITNVTFVQDGSSFGAAVIMSVVGLERSGNVNVVITVSGDDEHSSMAKRIRDAFVSLLESATASPHEEAPSEPAAERINDDNSYTTPVI